MSSAKLETKVVSVSWSNIQAWIEAGLRSMKGFPDSKNIIAIKLDYAGGHVSMNKIIPISIISREQGVEAISCE